MIKQPKLMRCCDCGYAVDKDKMFIKQYNNTAICLCKKCAEHLKADIDAKFGRNESIIKSKRRVQ